MQKNAICETNNTQNFLKNRLMFYYVLGIMKAERRLGHRQWERLENEAVLITVALGGRKVSVRNRLLMEVALGPM